MAKLDTLFFGAAHTYVAHIREYPPGLHPMLSNANLFIEP